jgi:RNA polymerase sigma-70 factor (ECF subfamily)
VTTAASPAQLERQLEDYRRELTGYCYRMLGSAFDAEDAVQETMVRAWRSLERFEGRAALKSWLYRIATNVCLDMLSGKERRIRPLELGAPGGVDSPLDTRPATEWLEPIPDGQVLSADDDPARVTEERETLRLAFVAALQHLPPQQRAVLILREVLRWRANEVAELLETSVASVNSALQRARASLDASQLSPSEPLKPLDDGQKELLQRYVAAFEAYDMDALTSLLHEDARQSMPPYEMWLLGREDILGWWFGPGAACRGSKLIPTVANGLPAFGQYRPSGPGGAFEPWALQVLEFSEGRIVGFTAFLDTERLFPLFGLPAVPPE